MAVNLNFCERRFINDPRADKSLLRRYTIATIGAISS